jgi:SPP1 gp7 family putative phage head morphogenesis protein
MNYWQKRNLKAQQALSEKSVKEIEKKLAKYYGQSAKRVIDDFVYTYEKLIATIEAGKEPTPADLYKLDKYWEMTGQIRQELRKLGEKQNALLTKQFEINYFEVYHSINIEGMKAFSTIDRAAVRQMLSASWLQDGKNFSQRIWENTELLVKTLDEKLIECVATGKKPTQLKHLLQERFNVSYSRADTLVRTEIAHIQTAAAAQRYKDYGLDYYEILGNEDDSCGNHSVDCHKMDGEKIKYSEMVEGKNAPPFHPNCKCSIVPVID